MLKELENYASRITYCVSGVISGLMPPSFMCVHAGTALNQLTSTSDAITWSSIAMLFFFIFISLIPILIKG